MTTIETGGLDATRLALDRTRLAHERTLMAWVRTATSLISFGFTIYKFFDYLGEERGAAAPRMFGPRGFAVLMIGTGLVALLLATLDHRRYMQGLRAEAGPLPYSLATVVGALIACLGLFGLASILFRF
jgi:putative membrane protein